MADNLARQLTANLPNFGEALLRGAGLDAGKSRDVAKVLVEKVDIKLIGTVQDDIAAMMAGK